MPSSIEKLHREFKDQGLAIWAIDIVEPRGLVEARVRQQGLTFPVLLDPDGTVVRAYGVRATPTVVLVDRAGILLGGTVGARDWDPDGRTLIAALLTRPRPGVP